MRGDNSTKTFKEVGTLKADLCENLESAQARSGAVIDEFIIARFSTRNQQEQANRK